MRLIPFCLVMILTIQCATPYAKTKVNLNDIDRPVSMSGYIYNPKGKIVRKGAGFTTDTVVAVSHTDWTVVYGLVKFSDDQQLVAAFNQAMKERQYAAAINLTVLKRPCGINYLFPLTATPVWPSCHTYSLTAEGGHFE